NEIDPNLIRKAFKYCDISNTQDSTEDSLIFDYDRLNQYTNSHNHIYVQDEFENSSESLVEVINLMSEDDTNNEAEANSIHEYKADSDNDNEASGSEDDYYKAEEINYINDWI
ncbi:8958_t:CDS:2, partial [Scutellospora calospora]